MLPGIALALKLRFLGSGAWRCWTNANLRNQKCPGGKTSMICIMETISCREKSEPFDAAIAFEEYRLQIVTRWPESDRRRDLVISIEWTLQRLREERTRVRRRGPEAH